MKKTNVVMSKLKIGYFDIFLIGIMVVYTLLSIRAITRIPDEIDLERKRVFVEDLVCGKRKSHSYMNLVFKNGDEKVNKVVKTITDCSQGDYEWLKKNYVDLLWSPSNKLSIWGVYFDGDEWVSYNEIKSNMSSAIIQTLLVFWCLFLYFYFVVFRRKGKKIRWTLKNKTN